MKKEQFEKINKELDRISMEIWKVGHLFDKEEGTTYQLGEMIKNISYQTDTVSNICYEKSK